MEKKFIYFHTICRSRSTLVRHSVYKFSQAISFRSSVITRIYRNTYSKNKTTKKPICYQTLTAGGGTLNLLYDVLMNLIFQNVRLLIFTVCSSLRDCKTNYASVQYRGNALSGEAISLTVIDFEYSRKAYI